MNSLKIVTINVRGIRDKKKRHILINWLKKRDFEIVCLQETFVTQESLSDIEKDFHEIGKYFASCTDSVHSRGVGILISHKINQWKLLNVHRDTEGRKVMINIKNLSGEVYSISSLYVPNNLQLRIQFIKNCNDWVKQNAADVQNLVITGDFNTCYDEFDRESSKLDKSADTFNEFIKKNDLIDSFRSANPCVKGFTYIHASDSKRNSRIDYILVSKPTVQAISSSSVISCPAPDHKALGTILNFNMNKRGKGYWKLNNSLLTDNAYKAIIRLDILHTINTYGSLISKQELIELIKVIVKESSIRYSMCKKSTSRISQIENELDLIDTNMSTFHNPELIVKR